MKLMQIKVKQQNKHKKKLIKHLKKIKIKIRKHKHNRKKIVLI